MTQENEGLFRPYAPPANMQAFLHRLRRMNMPQGITRDLLKTIGISENIIPRLFATLRFLELITDRDEPTDTLRGLAGSTEDEYRQLLEKTIRSAYADDFERIDPSRDPQERVMNAFQRYTPRSQHSRQVMLFLGLCREAGIPTVDVPRRRGMRGKPQSQTSAGRAVQPRSMQGSNGQSDNGIGAKTTQVQRDGLYVATQFLGITLEDAAHMPEEDYWEVWNAVGTIFLRRAQRVYMASQQDNAGEADDAEAKGFR
ncbi:MAG: DUF5343 domain-containing protein [Chloroflexi bacterium]|nr:DUF5343 domain-containing protein [Chloroflexota bacterium]